MRAYCKLFKNVFIFSTCIIFFHQVLALYNNASGEDRLAVVSEAKNDVKIQHEGQWLEVKMVGQRVMNSSVFESDIIETLANSSASVLYADATLISVKENSLLGFKTRELSAKEKARLGNRTKRTVILTDGSIWGSITPSKAVLTEFETPSGIGSVRGTEVGIAHSARTNSSSWTVADGSLRLESRAGSMVANTIAGRIDFKPGSSIATVSVKQAAGTVVVQAESGKVSITTRTGTASLKEGSKVDITITDSSTGAAKMEVKQGEVQFEDSTTGKTQSIKAGGTIDTKVDVQAKADNKPPTGGVNNDKTGSSAGGTASNATGGATGSGGIGNSFLAAFGCSTGGSTGGATGGASGISTAGITTISVTAITAQSTNQVTQTFTPYTYSH